MGERFGAVFPIVVIGVIADLLVKLLLGIEIVGMLWGSIPRQIRGIHRG